MRRWPMPAPCLGRRLTPVQRRPDGGATIPCTVTLCDDAPELTTEVVTWTVADAAWAGGLTKVAYDQCGRSVAITRTRPVNASARVENARRAACWCRS